MKAVEDYRFKCHELLIELDASTNTMMMLVAARELAGEKWSSAVSRNREAYAALSLHLNGGTAWKLS